MAALPEFTRLKITSKANLGCTLDVRNIALRARNVEYTEHDYLIMRIRNPRTKAYIHASGKIVCFGAKSENDSRIAARRYARIIQRHGYPARFLDFKILHIKAYCYFGFRVRLGALAHVHHHLCLYEPELRPELIYQIVQPRMSRMQMSVFASGQVVFKGAKVRQDIQDAFVYIFPILNSFRRH